MWSPSQQVAIIERDVQRKINVFNSIMDEISLLYQYIMFNKLDTAPNPLLNENAVSGPGTSSPITSGTQTTPGTSEQTYEEEVFATLPPAIAPQYVP